MSKLESKIEGNHYRLSGEQSSMQRYPFWGLFQMGSLYNKVLDLVYENSLGGYVPHDAKAGFSDIAQRISYGGKLYSNESAYGTQYFKQNASYSPHGQRFHMPLENYLGRGAHITPMKHLRIYHQFCPSCGGQQLGSEYDDKMYMP